MAKIYNETSDTLITGTNGNDSIENYYGSSVTIYGGAGNDSIYNHGANNSTVNNVIDGGIGNDYIVSDGYPNYGATVKGGEGNDTIHDYSYHSVLDGGAGDDYLSLRDDSNSERLIKYRAGDGNDTISGLSDMDTVEIAATAYSSVRSGNNIVVTVGDGSITFVGAVNRSVYIDLVNDTTPGGGSDTQSGGDGFDYIVGGNAADKLYGEDGNDTLWGGKGNDTLYGGEGADTFLYSPGDGKDVIYDFDEDDMLQITGTVTGTYYAGSNTIVFKVNGSSSNTITLRDYETSTFNINGDFYEIKGSKVVKQ